MTSIPAPLENKWPIRAHPSRIGCRGQMAAKSLSRDSLELFTAHEAMQLDLEEALTRKVGGKFYTLSAHTSCGSATAHGRSTALTSDGLPRHRQSHRREGRGLGAAAQVGSGAGGRGDSRRLPTCALAVGPGRAPPRACNNPVASCRSATPTWRLRGRIGANIRNPGVRLVIPSPPITCFVLCPPPSPF